MNNFTRLTLFFVSVGFLGLAISIPNADSMILNFKDLGSAAQTLFSWMFYGLFVTLIIMAGAKK